MKRTLAVIAIVCLVSPIVSAQTENQLTRQQAIDDIRKLADVLETTHPDPYSGGGGKIAFHRRLHKLLVGIPEEGFTKEEFYVYLLPFIAQVRDGHTSLRAVNNPQQTRLGLPIGFKAVDGHLYVVRVYFPEHAELMAARLEGINGVSYEQLLERQGLLQGWENIYNNITHLRRNLGQYSAVQSLLPESAGATSLDVTFLLKSGEERTVTIALPESLDRNNLVELQSDIELPEDTGGIPTFGFLDAKHDVGYLRIANMVNYREAFEWFHARGMSNVESWAKNIYRNLHKEEPPENIEDVIAGIPAATDVFRDMTIAMKEANSSMLIIDLRDNGGGNSLISGIFAYFLYGLDAQAKVEDGYTINRYSELFFSTYEGATLEGLSEGLAVPLRVGDYDFRYEFAREESSGEQEQQNFEQYKDSIPSFYAEVKDRRYENYYRPANVVVLTSAGTFSSAFSFSSALYKLGAIIVGVPSGQSGNSYGDQLFYTLPNSGISGSVSYKYFLDFPDDPELGYMLRPHIELTYERWKAYDFDRNASVRLALDSMTK